MRRFTVILSAGLLLATLPGLGQNSNQYPDRRDSGQNRNNNDNRNNQNNRQYSNFNNGLRDGGRGGEYYDPRHANDGYDQRYQENNRYYQQQQQRPGGIGPGKGAVIGGAGGAILGALFGGGLKGTIIGGAAGAGIGAAVGKVHQNNQRRSDSYPR